MGQVIQWPGPESRPKRPLTDSEVPKGRILLFLGVRYERHEAHADARSKARSNPTDRPSRRRKRG